MWKFHTLPFKESSNLEKAIQSAGAISDRSTCAAKTYAVGSGLTGANPGRKAEFGIISCDSQNCRRKLGGDVYAVKLKAKRGGREFKVDVKDQDDGTYLAEYTIPDNLILHRVVSTHCPCACVVLTSWEALLLYKLCRPGGSNGVPPSSLNSDPSDQTVSLFRPVFRPGL